MGKTENSRMRIIAVYRILQRGGKVTSAQIRRELETRYGITCQRQTICDDILAINRFIPVETTYGCYGGYQIVDVIGRCEDGK